MDKRFQRTLIAVLVVVIVIYVGFKFLTGFISMMGGLIQLAVVGAIVIGAGYGIYRLFQWAFSR